MSVVETAWLPDTRGMVFCWWGFRVHMLSGTRMFLGTIEHPAPTHPTPKKDLDYASSSQLGQVRSHQRAFTSMGDVHRLACLSNKQTPKLYVSKAIPVWWRKKKKIQSLQTCQHPHCKHEVPFKLELQLSGNWIAVADSWVRTAWAIIEDQNNLSKHSAPTWKTPLLLDDWCLNWSGPGCKHLTRW